MQSTEVMESFSKDFAALTLNGMQRRPDNGGSAGRKIGLLTNSYPIILKDDAIPIHHYDVLITAVQVSRPGSLAAVGGKKKDPVAAERGLPVRVCRDIWAALGRQHRDLALPLGAAAYDGRKGCFTPNAFPWADGQEIRSVTLPPHSTPEGGVPRLREFTVKISHVQTIDLTCLAKWTSRAKDGPTYADPVATAIQALDVLLRHDQFLQANVLTGGQGRKFFSSRSGSDIGLGAEVLSGFFQSVRPTVQGLVLNLDTAYSPFLKAGQLQHVAFAIVGRGASHGSARGGRGGRGGRGRGGFASNVQSQVSKEPFSKAEIRELSTKLRGAKVRVTHRASTKEYVIMGFGDSASKHSFSLDVGPKPARPGAVQVAQAAAINAPRPEPGKAAQQSVTVASYFKQKYNMNLQYPELQVVELRGKEFVPMEALELLPGTGIPSTRLSREQGSDMIRIAAQRPEERQSRIATQRREIGYESNARIAAWGVQTSGEMMKLDGRVLAPPKVQYHAQGKVKQPSVGRGMWNLVDTRFVGPNKPLEHWGVLSFANEHELPRGVLENFMRTLITQMKSRGMVVRNERPVIMYGDMQTRLASIKGVAGSIVRAPNNPKQSPPELLIYILKDPKTYDDVKRDTFMSLPVPVVSQVLLLKNILKEKGVDQYCGNVTMKLNVKLWGTNWVVSPQDLPKLTAKTIMFGADVTHPPAPRGGDGVAPSIAAVVATQEGGASTYSSQIRAQEGRQEMIMDLKAMAVTLIKGWQAKARGQLPENVLFFRDGVSEGQYAAVVDQEVRAIKAACRSIDPKYNPKLTYIVAAKRHNIRFFPQNKQDVANDRSGNLPAGTVVDNGVTHPYLWDFYLQSHAGLVGTCRPTHYICLLDENVFTSDSMEKLCNSLCYSFARATRSVSMVPVAYYADICCTKARSLAYPDDDTSSVASGSATTIITDWIQTKLDRGVASSHKLPGMWFM